MFETTILTFSLIVSLCFKKQTLEVLLHVSFKVELLPTVEAIGRMLF